jgi:hypothetical protein
LDDLAWVDSFKRRANLGSCAFQNIKPQPRRDYHNHTKGERCQGLLIPHSTIGCEKNIKRFLRLPKKSAVLETAPTFLLRCSDFKFRESTTEQARKMLVE